MDFGLIKSFRMTLPINNFGAEYVILNFDGQEQKLDPMSVWNCGVSLGQCIIEHAQTRLDARCDIMQEPGIDRWVLSQSPNGNVNVQLLELPEKALTNQSGELFLSFSCRLSALVDAYRFMLKEFLDEYGAEKYLDEFHEEFPFGELKCLDQLGLSM